MSVRSPVNAKNSGRSRSDHEVLDAARHVLGQPGWRGMTAPITKAPKISAIPIASVVKADSSTRQDRRDPAAGTRPARRRRRTRGRQRPHDEDHQPAEGDGERDRAHDLDAAPATAMAVASATGTTR